jgi:hypothetical protein
MNWREFTWHIGSVVFCTAGYFIWQQWCPPVCCTRGNLL